MLERHNLSVPEIGIIAGTRAALGAGIGLLLADRLNPEQRRAVGWTLVGIGVVTTVPILIQLLGHRGGKAREFETARGAGNHRGRIAARH